LAKAYSPERLENACNRAIAIKAFSFKSVKSILKNRLDRQPLEPDQTEHPPVLTHKNIRGNRYYQQKEVTDAQ
jgi:hypothetical protein